MAKKTIRLAFNEEEDQTSFFTANEVDGSEKMVTLNVRIGGPKQAGLTEGWIDNKRIFQDKVGSFKNEPIRKNNQLNGKTLSVYTVVTDSIEEDANLTEVEYDLLGGVGEVHITLSKKVSQQGDSVYYKFEVFFFKI